MTPGMTRLYNILWTFDLSVQFVNAVRRCMELSERRRRKLAVDAVETSPNMNGSRSPAHARASVSQLDAELKMAMLTVVKIAGDLAQALPEFLQCKNSPPIINIAGGLVSALVSTYQLYKKRNPDVPAAKPHSG